MGYMSDLTHIKPITLFQPDVEGTLLLLAV